MHFEAPGLSGCGCGVCGLQGWEEDTDDSVELRTGSTGD